MGKDFSLFCLWRFPTVCACVSEVASEWVRVSAAVLLRFFLFFFLLRFVCAGVREGVSLLMRAVWLELERG